jgi:hypothetical protein
MKLDRNDNDDGLGKYALLLLRKLRVCETSDTFGPRYTPEIQAALDLLESVGALPDAPNALVHPAAPSGCLHAAEAGSSNTTIPASDLVAQIEELAKARDAAIELHNRTPCSVCILP